MEDCFYAGHRGAHPQTGWAFWWRWVVATNLGWFPGIGLGLWLARALDMSSPLLAALVAAGVAGLCFGGTQAFALRATLASPARWWWATACLWPLGVGAARLILDTLELGLAPLVDTVCVAFVGGASVGVPQARLLLSVTPRARHWPWVSAVSWAALFPGALAGLALVWWCRTPGPANDSN